MREPTAQRTRLKTAFFRGATVGSIVLTVVSVFVAASVTGRGTRAAIGEQRLARSGDHDIAYYEAGSGPVVVMLASWARPASDFDELTQTLIDAGFRTIGALNRAELTRVLAAARMQQRRWMIWLQTSTPYWSMHKPVQAKLFMSWDMPLETASLAPSRCIIPAARRV
jgi:hypothetical protein